MRKPVNILKFHSSIAPPREACEGPTAAAAGSTSRYLGKRCRSRVLITQPEQLLARDLEVCALKLAIGESSAQGAAGPYNSTPLLCPVALSPLRSCNNLHAYAHTCDFHLTLSGKKVLRGTQAVRATWGPQRQSGRYVKQKEVRPSAMSITPISVLVYVKLTPLLFV